LEGKDAQEFMRRISDAYRRAHKLLTSDQIRGIRGGLSQLRFAQEIGAGPASVKRWELGLVQDRSSDKLIRAFEKASKRRYVYDVPVRVALPAVYGSGPEGYAHGPPFAMENHCLSLLL
jgi:DNA-binding transcriptional regulator YiaG